MTFYLKCGTIQSYKSGVGGIAGGNSLLSRLYNYLFIYIYIYIYITVSI